MVNGIKKIKPRLLRIGIVALACILIVMVLVAVSRKNSADINSYEDCARAGGAIMESFPEQCAINGITFTNSRDAVDSSESLIGLKESEAIAKAASEGGVSRVVERDGESLPVTMDFAPGRLNLYVRDGHVYKVDIEGQAPQ